MNPKSRWLCFSLLVPLMLVGGSDRASKPMSEESPASSRAQLKPFHVTIDWVPSPEYYGFFYAKEAGLYRSRGLDVTISYASGAPVVAAQIATGSIYAGTTTSDNVLRMVARGGEFSRVVPLLAYNPAVLAVLPDSPIRSLPDVQGRTVGVNKQSSVYQQLLWLKNTGRLGTRPFNEYPIGYGGSEQLKAREVDAILAYTTNAVVDLERDGVRAREIFFGNEGVALYGLVLAFGKADHFKEAGLEKGDVDRFIEATKEGYQRGAVDQEMAAQALLIAQPTLDRIKLSIAIRKIVRLRSEAAYSLDVLDRWVDEGIDDHVRVKTLSLYDR